MEFRPLQHLVTVSEQGSLLAAARALGLTPAALTKSIQRLERALGTVLLDRGRRPARITDAGRKAVERARQAMGILEGLQEDVRAPHAAVEGRVRLGVGPLVADGLLVPTTSEVLRTAPRVSIAVRLGHWADCLAALKLGESDLFLGDVTTAAADPTLVARPFPSHAIVLFCRAGHPILKERTIAASSILAYPLVANTPPPWGVRWLQDLYRRARRPVPAPEGLVQVACDSVGLVRSVVVRSDFLGFATPTAIEPERRAGRVAVVRYDTSALRTNAGSVVVAGRSLSRATALLRDVAHAVAERSAATGP